MVRNYVRTTNRAAYTREQLLEAVEKVRNGELTAYRAAIAYKIPRPTIVARVYEKYGLKSKSLGRNTAIPEETEKKLAYNLHEMEKYGFGLTRTEIMEVVGDYVTKNNIETPFKNGIPGEDWFLAFKKRHNLSVKKPQAVENSRKKSCNPWVIYSYYELLKNTLDELVLHDKPSQIWNLDETSFSKDPSKTKVVGLRGFASTRTIASPGKDNTTVLLGCSAAGDKTPPLIIFKGKNLWDEWTSEEDYPGTVYAATKNGWMETDVFETYFEKVFLPTVGQNRPILLVYDGHSTHVGINIIEKAREAGITIMKIPPHTSDNLQPLDLAVNKSFKDKWDLTLVKWQRLHVGQVLPKKEFSKLIGVIWAQVDPKVCVAGFRKAGIFPFNSNAVPEEKFNPNQLTEWKKQQEHSTGLNEISTSSDEHVLKNLDHNTSDLRQTEIQSGNNVVYANDPYPISIPSLQSICLNYWNYAIERTTTAGQDHIYKIKSVNHDKQKKNCNIELSQSSIGDARKFKIVTLDHDISKNYICDARNFKKGALDHDVSKNEAKTSSPKLTKVTIIDNRPVTSNNITFEELLLQKIKAGGHSKKKRTKIAGGAEVITSEDVYKKQKHIEEEKSKKLKLREEKLANKRKIDENTTRLYKDNKKTKTGDSTSESKINKQLLVDEDSKHHDDKGKSREEKLTNKQKNDENTTKRLYKDKKKTKTEDSTIDGKINTQLLLDKESKHHDDKEKLRGEKLANKLKRDANTKTRLYKDKIKTKTGNSTSEREIHNQLKDEDSKHYDDKMKLRQFKRFENSHRKKGMKHTSQIKKLKTVDDSTSESDFEMLLMDDSDIEDCETWITEDSTSENEVNNLSKDETYIRDITNYEQKMDQSKKINSYRNKKKYVKTISECDIEIDLMESTSDIYQIMHNTINYKENHYDELVENDYDEPTTSTVDKGQWVLVKFSTKTSVKHYVGVVTDVNSDSVPTVKYARKSTFRSGGENKNTFVFPHVPDICDVRHLEDIVCKLPEPMIDRRGKFSFKMSFQGFNVQ